MLPPTANPGAPVSAAPRCPTGFCAHTVTGPDGRLLPESGWQPLGEHLRNVAELAAGFAASFGASEEAYLAGLWHDLGKYRCEFQRYLRGHIPGSAASQHAIFGAVCAAGQGLVAAALAIQGHHGGLHDLSDLQSAMSGHPLHPERAAPLLLDRLRADLGPPPAAPAAPAWADSEFALDVYTRLLFSCLVDADRLDTARFGAPQPSGPSLEPDRLLRAVEAERARKARRRPDGALLQIRNQIFDACLERASLPPGFFSLTAPTGGGKTLASMAFALAHAQRHGLRRVVVVIPYLSIIEQNAAEYRRILGRGVVVEHHSAAEPRSFSNPASVSPTRGVVVERHSAAEPAEAGEGAPAGLDLAAENWEAPVIVTTAVQFLESLFAASPSGCRKLHRIARSVVIFDEAQTLPTHLLSPIFSVLRELRRNYGASFVFCSATLPAFRRSASLPADFFAPGELREIAPDPPAAFRQLRRVNYHLPAAGTSLSWDQLAVLLAAQPRVLCVVNLTRHASELWQALKSASPPDQPPIHLSGAMCPQHRLDLIHAIAGRLRAGQACRVVSTQLVEAGVDLDFPVVWRALGPLDSIVQAAGRCNREGALPRGEVHVFCPAEHQLPPGIYRTAADQTAVTLARLGADAAERLASDPAIFPEYFQNFYAVVEMDRSGRSETSIQQDRQRLRFRQVARKAKVIPDGGEPVIVPFGPAVEMIAALRARAAGASRFTRADLRQLQRFMVNVRSRQFRILLGLGQLRPLLPGLGIFVLGEGLYHPELGVVAGQRPLEDFLQ